MHRLAIAWLGCLFAAGAVLAQTPVPLIYQPLQPTAVAPGGPGLTLTVRGTGFVSGAVVDWNGQPSKTTFVSPNELSAAVPAADVATAQTATITVHNPGVSVASNFLYFQVANPISAIHYVNGPGSPVWLGATNGNLNMPFSVAAGDFEGNGQSDIAVPINDGEGPGFLDLLLAHGDGTFALKPSGDGVGLGPGEVAVGDFDGDGRLDVATSNVDDNTVTVLLNNGGGTFSLAPRSPFAVGKIANQIIAADFNRDGKLDLAVARGANGSGPGSIYVFLGNGDGTFTPALGIPIGLPRGSVVGLAAGDFNGDGKLDLAATSYGDGIFVLLGNGDGTFGAANDIALQPYFAGGTTAIATADFNGDGKLDLAVAQNGNQTLDVFLGNGDGTFTQEAVPVPGCCANWAFNLVSAWAIQVGDFLANGKLDLVVTERNGNAGVAEDYLLVYLGNGDGTFTPSEYSTLLPESPTTALTIGDFNNDGLLDFATASMPQNYYNILLEQPGPAPAPDFSLSAKATSVTVQPGAAATYSLGVTSLDGFTGAVYLTCSGLPAMATCAFTPPYDPLPYGTPATGGGGTQIDPTEGAGVVVPGPANGPPDFLPTLKIQTTAPTANAAAPPPPTGESGRWLAIAAGLVLAALLLAAVERLRRRAHRWALLGVVLLAGVGAWSCGGAPPVQQALPPPPPSGTPAGTYTITITATAYKGSPLAFTHLLPLTLVVQPAPTASAHTARALNADR